jgi:hypothetical protein
LETTVPFVQHEAKICCFRNAHSSIPSTKNITHRYFQAKEFDVIFEVTANVIPSSPILVTLMMEVLSSSETPVLTRATRRNITTRHHSSKEFDTCYDENAKLFSPGLIYN